MRGCCAVSYGIIPATARIRSDRFQASRSDALLIVDRSQAVAHGRPVMNGMPQGKGVYGNGSTPLNELSLDT